MRNLWRGTFALLLLALVLFSSYLARVLFFPVSAGVSAPGPQWQQVGLPGIVVHSLAFGHAHPGLAFAAANGVYRRDRNGSWHRVLASVTVWSVELLPDDKGIVAGDNSGDVHVSTDAGYHWRHVLLTSQGVYAVSAQPDDPRHLLAGAGGGIYLSHDGGVHWRRRLALPKSAATAFAWQPGSPRVVFAGAVAGDVGGSTDVYMSRDGGLTWHRFGSHLNSTGGVMSLLATPGGHVFDGTMGHAVWSASVTSRIWYQAANGMPLTNDHGAGLTALPGQSRTLFVGTLGQGVFRTTDGGNHWTNISNGLSPARSANVVLSVEYSPLERALYAGTTDGIYELTPAPYTVSTCTDCQPS